MPNIYQKWIDEHPEEVKLFLEAYESRKMTNLEIAQMLNMPTYADTEANGHSASAPFVSNVAKQLGLKPKRVQSAAPRRGHESPFSRIERLKKELAEAQKDHLRELSSDENKIRKFVESMGGISNFHLKLRMIKW